MTLNCKQGDLAFIKAPKDDDVLSRYNNHFVTCEELMFSDGNIPHWKVSPKYPLIHPILGRMGRIWSIADRCLRPVPKFPEDEKVDEREVIEA